MNRGRRIEQIRRHLDGRNVIWLGNRTSDGTCLKDLPELSDIVGLIAPCHDAKGYQNYSLESEWARRVDLNTFDIDLERCFEIDEPVDLEIARVLLQQQQILPRLSLLPEKTEAVVFDFDGVFTNNTVVVHQDGNEAVVCNRGDGMGISQLKKHGIPLVVMSTEKNLVVAARCRKLGLECHQNLKDKVSFLQSWLKERSIIQENVIYLGNDINDAECLKAVGCGVVTVDAHGDVKPLARIILKRAGGYGAVRELSDLIIKKLEESQNAKTN